MHPDTVICLNNLPMCQSLKQIESPSKKGGKIKLRVI